MRRTRRRDLHPAAPVPSWLPDLDGDANQDFLAFCPPSAQPRLLPADEGLVHLDPPGQPVPARMHEHRRSRCSIPHAVGYEPISSARCRLSAETPSLSVANIQAVNHTVRASAAGRTACPPSPTSACRRPRTCTGHQRRPTRREARTSGTRSPAIAASPGNPGNRRRSRTTTGTLRWTWGSTRPPEAEDPHRPQPSPVS